MFSFTRDIVLEVKKLNGMKRLLRMNAKCLEKEKSCRFGPTELAWVTWDTPYLQFVGDRVRQQVAQQNGRPQMKHKGHIELLPDTSGLFERHSVLHRHDADHQHAALTSPLTAGLPEVRVRLLVADVFVTEALGALILLGLIVLPCHWLKAQLRPKGDQRHIEYVCI